MKAGDLVFDALQGYGVILECFSDDYRGETVSVFFTDYQRTYEVDCCMLEVISESR